MELYLQYGWQMTPLCVELVHLWGGASVILSPRDIARDKLVVEATRLRAAGKVDLLFDPQLFLPSASHERLSKHKYWPKKYDSKTFWTAPGIDPVVEQLLAINKELGSSKFILPGTFANSVTEAWLTRLIGVMESARKVCRDEKIFATVALSSDAVRSAPQVHDLLESSERWDVDGVYLVCEHPNGQYLVDDPIWLSNVLDLISGFRLNKLEVIVGYSNQQNLVCASAGANAIASGNYLNVRSFSVDRFETQEEEDKRQALWYYCPHTLSEYKIQTLDAAFQLGELKRLEPRAPIKNDLAGQLFAGAQPSTVGYTRGTSVRHYLHMLKQQCDLVTKPDYTTTSPEVVAYVDAAETECTALHAQRIRGQERDFLAVAVSTQQALAIHSTKRGALLKRFW